MKKQLQYILTGAMLALLAVGIAACQTGAEELSAPANLTLSSVDILSWDEVGNAEYYVVTIDDEEYETETNSLDIFLLTTAPKTYEIGVTAYRDAFASESSERLEYTVNETPADAFQMAKINSEYSLKVKNNEALIGKVVVPDKIDGMLVRVISDFSDCTLITGLILPDSVERIGARAFSGCEVLERIKLPSRVDKIGSAPFLGRHNLKMFTIDEANASFRVEGNCLIRREDGALIAGCNESVIPQGVTSIGINAFRDCMGFKELKIPDGVTSIEEYAFFNCRELKELKIPASVTKIGSAAFGNCYALEKLELPNGLKELNGSSIFCNCKSLKSLNIPRTVEKVEVSGWTSLFCGAGLLSLTVDEGNPYYYSEGNCIIRKSDGVLVVGCDVSVIPDYVEEIGNGAFAGCNLKSITLPAGLKKIGSYAFEGCPLTSLYIPESVETIEGGAFEGCKLQSVILPGSVKTIGVGAFEGTFDIYTSAEADNEGWYHGDIYNPVSWRSYSTCAWRRSIQKDEDGLFYVNSIRVTKWQMDGITPFVPEFDPYRDGYIFKGWTTEEGGTEPLFEQTLWVSKIDGIKYERCVYLSPEQAKTLPEGETVLYAIWEKV